MYLLDRAVKIEEGMKLECSYLIENGQVRYVNKAVPKWKNKKVSMMGTVMMNGGVMLANTLLDCESFTEFKQEQIDYINKGCTTVVVAPTIAYTRQLETTYKRTKHKLANSTLDYLIGVTVPIHLLTPSLLRRCRRLHVPFIRVIINSVDEMMRLSWTHLSQTLANYQIVLIPTFEEEVEKEKASLLNDWSNYCSTYHIHTALPISNWEKWKKPLLQKVGLYPEKGVLLVGSDADYLLYPISKKQLTEVEEGKPTIVVVKGHVIKAGSMVTLKPGFGRQLKVRQPGRFLSIEARGMI